MSDSDRVAPCDFRAHQNEGIVHNSYPIGSGSEAAGINPHIDYQAYLSLLSKTVRGPSTFNQR